MLTRAMTVVTTEPNKSLMYDDRLERKINIIFSNKERENERK